MTVHQLSPINFRQVYASGGTAVFRSGDPTQFSAGAIARVGHHRIRTFIDLRTPRDVRRYGLPLALRTAVRYARAPLYGFDSRHMDKPRPTVDDYILHYRHIYEASAPSLRRIFKVIALVSAEPFVIACHCGKDRTSTVVAALLELIGRPRQEIMADYAATGPILLQCLDHFEDKWLSRGHSREDYATRMRTYPETVDAVLSQIAAEYGSIADFLRRIGVSSADIDTVQANFAAPIAAAPARAPGARSDRADAHAAT